MCLLFVCVCSAVSWHRRHAVAGFGAGSPHVFAWHGRRSRWKSQSLALLLHACCSADSRTILGQASLRQTWANYHTWLPTAAGGTPLPSQISHGHALPQTGLGRSSRVFRGWAEVCLRQWLVGGCRRRSALLNQSQSGCSWAAAHHRLSESSLFFHAQALLWS